jgi:NifU-like protein involved in Fe-S cluster formation
MADLDDIYSTRLLELASDIPRSERLARPGATAFAHSKLCGSTVAVDVTVADGRITEFGQTVQACLLGQAAAAIVGREIIGVTPAEFRSVARAMRGMLAGVGPPPAGRWADLALLEPVRDYKHRHASTLLVFDAVERALDEIEANEKQSIERGAAGADGT